MYRIDDVGSTYKSLPPNLQNIENQCFTYALDRQIRKLTALAKQLTVWSDLDNVNPKYYDYMAMCIRAPYYKSEYTNEKKLDLIKTAIASHRFAGSERAITQLLDTIFDNAKFIPWYEYGGGPYQFRVKVYDILTEDATTMFLEILQKVKAARSIMQEIEIAREMFAPINMGICTISTSKGDTIQ